MLLKEHFFFSLFYGLAVNFSNMFRVAVLKFWDSLKLIYDIGSYLGNLKLENVTCKERFMRIT